MNSALKINQNKGEMRKGDIIQAILDSDLDEVIFALSQDPMCVNSTEKRSGMNAVMLAAMGRMPTFLDEILKFSQYIDFSHTSDHGYSLLNIGTMSNDERVRLRIVEAYKSNAAHMINNWPEP